MKVVVLKNAAGHKFVFSPAFHSEEISAGQAESYAARFRAIWTQYEFRVVDAADAADLPRTELKAPLSTVAF